MNDGCRYNLLADLGHKCQTFEVYLQAVDVTSEIFCPLMILGRSIPNIAGRCRLWAIKTSSRLEIRLIVRY